MVCFWYDSTFGKNTCNYAEGYGFDECPCNGEVSNCFYVDHGVKVAEERKDVNSRFNKNIELSEEGYKKMKEADEKPVDHEALKEFKEKVKAVEKQDWSFLEFKGKIYNNGVPISQNKYNMLKEQGLLENDMYYLIEKKVDYKLDATKKWCSLSNAIIKKYKNMVEFDDESLARTQLKFIKKWLIDTGYFKSSDFEDWGE